MFNALSQPCDLVLLHSFALAFSRFLALHSFARRGSIAMQHEIKRRKQQSEICNLFTSYLLFISLL